MKILFIGYSNLVRRRILPFIDELDGITSIDIAKYHEQIDQVVQSFNLPLNVFNSYEEALEKSDAEIAYVSTVNSVHDLWCEKALRRGMHVIVDKPAFPDFKRTMELVNLSERMNLCLAEATVYSYHSQICRTLEMISEKGLYPLNITVNFSFPELDPENFRYRKSLGGGSLNDLGPYVVSAGRVFFNDTPEKAVCSINSHSHLDNDDNVETSFCALLKYSNGRTLIGNFGFNTEYINRINIFGSNFYFEINRAFTPPCDAENEIILKMNNKTENLKTGISNSFINFLKSYMNAINKKDYNTFRRDLIKDAEALELFKRNVIK